MRSVLLLAAALCTTSMAFGSTLQFALNQEYTGGAHPSGPPPWLRVAVDDHNANGSVTVTIQSLTLVDQEFVSKLLLNIKPPINPSTLSASAPSKTGTFTDPSIEFGSNAFNAGGGSSFDMLVSFATGGPSNRFGAGDSVSFNVTGSSALNSGSFNWLSSGGSGARLLSAHVQGIGNNGGNSGWITTVAPTPEPASVSLFAAAGLLVRRKR